MEGDGDEGHGGREDGEEDGGGLEGGSAGIGGTVESVWDCVE